MLQNTPFNCDQLLSILNLSKDATAIYSDSALTIAYVNEAMLRIWGKDASIRGMRFDQALPEMDGQEFTALLKQVWNTGKTYQAKDNAADLNVDGQLQTFYFDFTYRPVLDGAGNTYAIIHTATEVSERMAAWQLVQEKQESEQQYNEELTAANEELTAINEELKDTYDRLSDTESRLHQLVKSSPVGMTILDGHDLVIEQANTHLLAIWGRTADQVLGKKLMDIFPELESQPFPQMLADVLNTGHSVASKEIAVDIADTNGDIKNIYVDFAYEPLRDNDGEVTSVLVTVTDITDIVHTRKQLSDSEVLLQEMNEELAAANEEYQTTNEELQTMNEEYTVVNEELKTTNEQLHQISSELEKANTLLNKTNAGLLFENAALSESEKKALALFANAPVAIGLLSGSELVVESANTDILRLWGKSAAIIGMPLVQAMPELKGQPFLDLLGQVFSSGEAFFGTEAKAQIVYNGKLTDRYFNFVYQPVKDEAGKTTYIMVVATDVTPQVEARQTIEQAEEKFRLIADNISQFAWMTDAEGNIFWFNQRWFDYTGASFADMQGWGWLDVIHPDQVDNVAKKFKRSLRTGESWEDTFPLLRHDGEYRWFLSRAVPTRDAQGKIISWFGTNTDITEQRELDLQKDDFMSIASHELKTPLTSLRANLQILERMKDKITVPAAPRIIDSANKSMQKITGLVDDLLNINRFTEGKLELQKSYFKVWDMLEGCCNHIRVEQKFELVIQGDKNIEIYADEHRIDQVVVNFVNNAVKYAPASKKIFLIVEKLNHAIKIAVRDTGPGIAQEQIPHLFDRYWRADHSGNQYSGLGLGLFICAEIIHRHDGEIGVDSEPGKGSTFWFTLPDVASAAR